MNNINIIDYKPEHQTHFENLNRKWIQEHYELEMLDLFVLRNPDEAIIRPGGAILVATCDGEVAGVLALRKLDAITFEYTKMAVDERFRRRGIGEALSYASFEKARKLGATKIILYSNKLQAAAIKLYEKLGFIHLPVEPGVYKRANVKMEMVLPPLSNSELENWSMELSQNLGV